ncbi:PIG-L family deacetylase [Nocardia sp. NBC_01499]|uniref:PIG-L deacetylase family protein n=1 Tax=Nocardia sp. NBC_01499 TaxID=2903597 RepID=UPI00386FEA7A
MPGSSRPLRVSLSEICCGAAGIVVLSPHFDDAALAVGGLIAEGIRAGIPVEVVTVFTDGAPISVEGKRRRAFTDYGVRRAEDDRALAVWGIAGRRLGFRERLFREPLPSGPLPLFRSPRRLADLSYVAEIEAVIIELLTRPDIVVFAPLGIGNHIDHVTVAAAAMCAAAASTDGDERVVYYEDFNALSECCRRRHPVARTARFGWRGAPGLARPGSGITLEAMSLLVRGPSADALVERSGRVGATRWSAVAVVLSKDVADIKFDAVRQYRSQTAVLGGEDAIVSMIRRSHERRGGELIWRRYSTAGQRTP